MTCPHCGSVATAERSDRPELGYRRFRCRACKRSFNERTGTPDNRLQYPMDVVSLVALWRVRYKLSLRDLTEMLLQRGIVFTHETVRDWETRHTPVLIERLRKKRRGSVSRSWYVDETCVRVQGRWQYLYRALNQDGNLVDVRLYNTQDLAAAEAFFRPAWTASGVTRTASRPMGMRPIRGRSVPCSGNR
jgi:putative transposase